MTARGLLQDMRAKLTSVTPARRADDVTVFCRSLACIQLACACVAILWVVIDKRTTVDTVGMLGVVAGGVVFGSVLLHQASRIGWRWLGLVALLGTSWLSAYSYFGGETATTFGMFDLVSVAVVAWYMSDSATIAQLVWMIVTFWLALWVRVYPGEQLWPYVYRADVDTLLVWGAALCTATVLIRLFKRRVVDSDQRLAAIVECSPDAVVGEGRDGRITVWNPGAEQLYGYSGSEALGQPISLLVGPDREGEDREILDRVLAGEQIEHFLTERVCKDGSRVIVSLAVAPLRDGAGRVCGTSSVARDMTSETAAARTIALQAQLLDEIDAAVVFNDSAGLVRYCNRASEELYGYTFEELSGRNLLDLIFPSATRSEAQDIRLDATVGRPSEGELNIHDRQGRVFPVHVRIRRFSLEVADRAEAGIVTVATDMSARRAAERVLSESRAHLELAQRAAGIGSWQRDLETGGIRWSGAMAALHNLPGDEPASIEAFASSMSAEDWALVRATIEHCLESGAELDGEYRVSANEHGAERIISGRVCRIDSPGSGATGLLGVCQDVTERVRREHEEAASLARSVFLSRMSHELRTPLNAILGFGQLLEQGDLSAQDQQNAARIVVAGRHLLGLIEEVLDISGIEAGEVKFEQHAIDARALVQELAAMTEPQCAPRRLRLTTDLGAAEVRVLADARRLRQALSNLLSNAVKYNSDGGQLRLTLRSSELDGVCISVSDDGPGIAAENIPRLFIPFDRIGAERSEVYGTGLGLTVTKALIEAMDGSLRVESTVGGGSTFSLWLPSADSPAFQSISDPLPGSPPLGATRQDRAAVLCVEDNADNMALIEALLGGDARYALLKAADCDEGLRLARREHPALILLDVMLGEVSGLDVLAALKSDPATAGIPVVVLSADANHEHISDALAAGAISYLTKPLELGAFYRAIDEALNGTVTTGARDA
jgi:PAS domain S-box-containing protein